MAFIIISIVVLVVAVVALVYFLDELTKSDSIEDEPNDYFVISRECAEASKIQMEEFLRSKYNSKPVKHTSYTSSEDSSTPSYNTPSTYEPPSSYDWSSPNDSSNDSSGFSDFGGGDFGGSGAGGDY